MAAGLRYVVLHHTGIDEPHYDLMIEPGPGAALWTWRIAHWPPLAEDVPSRQADHRREYLEYEGEISGNRGQVRRVASGCTEVVESSGVPTSALTDGGLTIVFPMPLEYYSSISQAIDRHPTDHQIPQPLRDKHLAGWFIMMMLATEMVCGYLYERIKAPNSMDFDDTVVALSILLAFWGITGSLLGLKLRQYSDVQFSKGRCLWVTIAGIAYGSLPSMNYLLPSNLLTGIIWIAMLALLPPIGLIWGAKLPWR